VLRLLVFISASVLGLGSAVAQQPQALVLIDGVLSCQPLTGCDPDMGPGCSDGAVCGQVGPDETWSCTHLIDTFLCCDGEGAGDADAKCVITNPIDGSDNVDGRCIEIDGVPGVAGVCQFGEEGGDVFAPTFCEDDASSPLQWIVPCLTSPPPESMPIYKWRQGDCDEDGTPNGIDYDLGCGPCDPTMGASADLMSCDINDPPDAGPDTAVTPPTPDARTQFRGVGGCNCDVATDRRGAPTALMALFVFALALFRSCRRAGRQHSN
jgi:hypothetical protein